MNQRNQHFDRLVSTISLNVPIDATQYQSVVDALQYLSFTWP